MCGWDSSVFTASEYFKNKSVYKIKYFHLKTKEVLKQISVYTFYFLKGLGREK